MSFTKLADPCESCLYAKDCDHKHMAAVAELPIKPIDISLDTKEKLEGFKQYVNKVISETLDIPIEVLTEIPTHHPYVEYISRNTVPVNINGKLDKMYKDELDAILYAHNRINILQKKG